MPSGYRPATAWERRTVDVTDNRRRSWMLELAHAGMLVPPGASVDDKVALVLEHRPDLFPDADTAAAYVHDEADREIALEIAEMAKKTQNPAP